MLTGLKLMNLWLKLDETNRKNLGISLRENFQIVKKISLIVWILNLHKNPYSKIEKKKKMETYNYQKFKLRIRWLKIDRVG